MEIEIQTIFEQAEYRKASKCEDYKIKKEVKVNKLIENIYRYGQQRIFTDWLRCKPGRFVGSDHWNDCKMRNGGFRNE